MGKEFYVRESLLLRIKKIEKMFILYTQCYKIKIKFIKLLIKILIKNDFIFSWLCFVEMSLNQTVRSDDPDLANLPSPDNFTLTLDDLNKTGKPYIQGNLC